MQAEPALAPPAKVDAKGVRKPLAAATYLLRNSGKTVPLIGVIMLAVMLIGGIVAMINSITFSIQTIYSYSATFLGVNPRGVFQLTPQYKADIIANTPVPIDRIMEVRATGTQVRSLVGKWPFAVLGMQPKDVPYYLSRLGVTGIQGRVPKEGAPEVLISEPVARNLKIKIGSVLLEPSSQESYSPFPVKVVGIARTDKWAMVTDYTYLNTNHPPPIDNLLIFARNRADQIKLDNWAFEHFKGERVQLFAYKEIDQQSKTMFRTLYQILNVVIGTLVIVITFMMGMLINIYQSQRMVEFGLLQALGYTKRQLLRRVLKESAVVVVFGWVFGVLLGYGLLLLVKRVLMDPNGFALLSQDPVAFRYTFPVPIAIMGVALLTVFLRFRKFDPVGVVERRLL